MAKILVADDESSVRRLLEIILVDAGHEAVLAEHGQQALDLMDASPDIDLLVLDVMMPEVDGFGVMEALRNDDRFQGLPVIMLTALIGAETEKAGYDAGVDAFMTKPFDPDVLVGLIEVTLATSGYSPPAVGSTAAADHAPADPTP